MEAKIVVVILLLFVVSIENLPKQKRIRDKKEGNNTSINEYRCNACDKCFTYKSALKRHNDTTHLGIKNHVCDVCNKSFTRKSDLKIHNDTHLGIKDHVCYVCNKSFTRKSHLIRHYLTHSVTRDYKCNVCGNCFKHKHSLKIHCKKYEHDNDHLEHLSKTTQTPKPVSIRSEENCNQQQKRKLSETQHDQDPNQGQRPRKEYRQNEYSSSTIIRRQKPNEDEQSQKDMKIQSGKHGCSSSTTIYNVNSEPINPIFSGQMQSTYMNLVQNDCPIILPSNIYDESQQLGTQADNEIQREIQGDDVVSSTDCPNETDDNIIDEILEEVNLNAMDTFDHDAFLKLLDGCDGRTEDDSLISQSNDLEDAMKEGSWLNYIECIPREKPACPNTE